MLGNLGRGIEVRGRYNRQIQPWCPITTELERKIDTLPSIRTGIEYEMPRPLPWKSEGYRSLALAPLKSIPLTDTLVSNGYGPSRMSTEPLYFPNLVTGFSRNAAHAARSALYTRYTPDEWMESNIHHYNESDTIRNYSERLRNEFIKVMRETDEQTATNQRISGRTLGERVNDITFWRNELSNELHKLIEESLSLADQIRALDKAYQDLEGPLHISQECLYQREHREGIDLVHDQVEQSLLREIDLIKNYQIRLKNLSDKCKEQQNNNRACQNLLETDVRSKEGALGIDTLCHQLNNYSRGLAYYGGIEKYDPTVSTPESWAENSNRNIQRSQAERVKSSQCRSESESLINTCSIDVWDAWSNTNNAFTSRISELLETKSSLQLHLQKVQHEIFEVEKNIEMLRKAIIDKTAPMKVAQTRLEARSHRKGIENSKDDPFNRLITEVNIMQNNIDNLHRRLQEAEAQLQELLRTKNKLETDLSVKVNSLFIDRDKCMGMRRSYPVTATIKY